MNCPKCSIGLLERDEEGDLTCMCGWNELSGRDITKEDADELASEKSHVYVQGFFVAEQHSKIGPV